MSRPGISYTEVAQAASQLLGQGKNPTIEQIRRLLGTGSSTTLSQHLRRWKKEQGETQKLACKENLPEEFLALMKGLWERVISQADEQVAQIETQFGDKLSKLENDLAKYKTNNQRWQQLHNLWIAEKSQLSKEKTTAEKKAQQSLQELSALNQKQELLVQQLQDKQDRLKELQRLHQQNQENLEHNRESTRTQRLVEQQRQEKDKHELELRIRELKEKMNGQKTQVKKIESQLAKLETRHQADLLKVENYKNQQQEAEEKLRSQNKKLLELQTETRVLASQLTQTNQQLQAALDKNKHLEAEKLDLIKKKSHLEGRLKVSPQALEA